MPLGNLTLGKSLLGSSTKTDSDGEITGFVSFLGHELSYLGNMVLGKNADLTVPGAEQLTYNVLFLTQIIKANAVREISVESEIVFNQASARIFQATANSSLSFNQETIFDKYKNVSGTNTLLFGQELNVEKTYNKKPSQNLVLSHQLKRNISKIVEPSNILILHQNVIGINTKFTTNSINFTQTVDYFISKGAKNIASFTQSIKYNADVERHLNDVFGVFQTVQSGPNTLRRILPNTLALFQQAKVNVVKGISQSFLITQSLLVNKVKGAESTLSIVDEAKRKVNFNRITTDLFGIFQEVSYNKVKNVSAKSIYAPQGFVKKTKILTLHTESIFHLDAELVNSRYIRNVSHSLLLTQNVEILRESPQKQSSNLVLTQTVSFNRLTNLIASNTLIFKNSFDKRIGVGPISTIPVETAQVVKVKNFVVLTGPGSAITLPAPEFDDSEAFTGAINILRFKTGGKRVYKSDTERRVLEYSFVLDGFKARELKNFVRACNSIPFYLENWKGEKWYVLFNNNPFNFIEESYIEKNPITGANKFTIPLSFEGVRIN